MKKLPKPFFSIVIPALNEEKYLPLLLRDLSKQDFTDFEVIVVEGSSEDKTVVAAKKFEKRLSLQIYTVEKRNVSYQRNYGAEKAKGEWVIFMDADNRLEPYFLQGIRYQLSKNPDTDFFTTWIAAKSTNQMDQLWAKSINLSYEISGRIINKPQCFGALLGCKKQITKEHIFDENQLFFEDVQYLLSLSKHGYIFKVFREPTFFYSLRRIKKEGKIRTTYGFITSQIHYIQGGDFNQPYSETHYPMLGGTYYQDLKDKKIDERWVITIQNFIKTASQKQLEQARRILTSIMDA